MMNVLVRKNSKNSCLCFKCPRHVLTWQSQCRVHSLAAIKTCLNSDMAAVNGDWIDDKIKYRVTNSGSIDDEKRIFGQLSTLMIEKRIDQILLSLTQ